MMNYKDYLESNQWKELRKQARKRAKDKCELCNRVDLGKGDNSFIPTCSKCCRLDYKERKQW
jgi:hypothetical protein